MKKVEIYDNGVNVEFLWQDIVVPIEKVLDKLQIIDVKSFSIGIIFNKKFLNMKKEFESKEKFASIINYNTPVHMDGKQDVEIQEAIKQITNLLESLNRIKLEEAGAESITILFLYNKLFDEIHIEGLKKYKKQMSESKTEDFIFIPTAPKYKFEQVVLNENLDKEIKKTLIILEHRELIYDTWGFGEIEPAPKAILNFHGPSGTGKTMTAQAIADYLGIKIMALNYADIESKYVGDAPKNLLKAFDVASKEKALLFFDEADSFLGKRITNISSSSDQAVNSLRSQLLILLENFEGIIIFATNLIQNYDKAFESRIFKHLNFQLPDETNRIAIIKKSIPNKLPFKGDNKFNDIEFTELAKISEGFSGRHIKNAVLNALTNAVLNNISYVSYGDFKNSFMQLKQSMEEMSRGNEQDNKQVINGLSSKRKYELEQKIANKLKNSGKKRF